MACSQQSALIYLKKTWGNLVSQMQNFPVIVENLYQRRIFNDWDVNAVKAKWTESDKARYILHQVINKGERASYELLKILDFTWKRTLCPSLHKWIKRYSFRKDSEANYSFGTKPCQDYQTQLKVKAKSVLENQREQSSKYLLHKQQENFHFIPLASEKEYGMKNPQSKLENKKQRYKKHGAYIPNKEETISPTDLLKMQNQSILLTGRPGIGKTTVVQQMLHLWTEKKDTDPDYMFYFNESIVSQSRNFVNLESLLFDVYVKAKEEDQQEVLQDIEENSENVVFIFDGVTCVQEHSILKKIMDHDVLPKAKVIITCRSEFEADPFFSDWPSQKVYVQGFSEESIRTYYQMMLGHNPDLLDVVLNNQELFSLSYVPLYAFMIVNVILLKTDHQSSTIDHPTTVTNMNMQMFLHALMKCGDKNLLQINEYLKDIKDQLYLLMKNAFSSIEQKSLNLPEISCDETNICHVFLKTITITDSLTSAVTYCKFFHNTMQEFFSALWLLGNPDEIEKVLKLCQTEENKHMRHLLPFLSGLLGEHNRKLLKCLFPEDQMKKTSEWFIEKLLDTFFQSQSDIDLLYVCQCLYELQSSKACLIFLEKMNHQLDVDVNLDPHQSCALSYVISQSRDKEVYLNMDDCTVSDAGMNMILSSSPQIRLKPWKSAVNQIKFLLRSIPKASIRERSMEIDERMISQYCWNSFSFYNRNTEMTDALLNLYSHVKDYETQTGRSFFPALQSVFQTPDVWIIDLSKRKTSILLEVLKLQTQKKPVELRDWSDEESEVMSFLHCLPYISQLMFRWFQPFEKDIKTSAIQFLLRLIVAAVDETFEEKTFSPSFSSVISSVCCHKTFPFQCSDVHVAFAQIQCAFLLDLYSHVKDYESQTGRNLLPALQAVFQTPDVWSIDLSERKTSILLEVLKLQTQKKPVKLRGYSDEESEVMSFLHCLPYISQLSFYPIFSVIERNTNEQTTFFVKLFTKAAETKILTGDQMLKLLTSVWNYKSMSYDTSDNIKLCDFLLDLYLHAADFESETGRSVLPELQSVFQTPDVWIIDLSERKTSILLEVLKLQTQKKTVELRGYSDEESEMMSFLHCLPYISQLRFDDWSSFKAHGFFVSYFIKAAETEAQTGDQMLKRLTSVCTYTSFPTEHSNKYFQSGFLLDLYSDLRDYESQTGRNLLPALQSVFQVPDVWSIDLSKRKTSILLEVLKLQTQKKTVELRGYSDKESEMMSFLHCLPYISQLRFGRPDNISVRFISKLFIKAAETERQTGDQMLKLLTSVCTYSGFPFMLPDSAKQSDFLFDIYSHVKDYESQTGRNLLPALQAVFQAPDVWSIDLSKRKTSILLEVMKLQTQKKTVELRRYSDEESEVMSFLHCLPYISQLRFDPCHTSLESKFLLKLFIKAAETERHTGDQMLKLLTSVCTYTSFPYGWKDNIFQSDFLLDLYSYVKDYESQTGRNLLPALQSVFQAPDVWSIDLSKRKTSILLEVMKLQTQKKPVKLRRYSDEESEVMSFLHCLPYISQLRFDPCHTSFESKFLLKLFIKAAETESHTGDQMLKLLTSVCTYTSFPYGWKDKHLQSDFLLDLYSHVKDYESQTGRNLLPALQSVFQTPDVWSIDLSKRKTSILLEVMKLQTQKKTVELRGYSDEESEVMSFLHCLPYISQLRFTVESCDTDVESKNLLKLFIKAAEAERQTGDQMLKLLTSVCTYSNFPYKYFYSPTQCSLQSDFLLNLYSHVKDYDSQTGKSFFPALQPVYVHVAPDVWIIDLSERKTSILLEVLKLQTQKKPVELRGYSDEESEVMSFLHCLPYISQLRFDFIETSVATLFLLQLVIKAAETERHTGDQMLKLLTSVCTYTSFPYGWKDKDLQSDFLLDLYSHVKDCESQTGRNLLPALQSVFQTPDVWSIDLSERKTSILLEVLKLQTQKKTVELRGYSDEESEVMSFLHCLPYISRLRFTVDSCDTSNEVKNLLKLFIKAAETERQTGDQMLKLLTSVCTYSNFPFELSDEHYDRNDQSDFLLDLYSHVKDYESQTGRNLLPALQSVFQTPDVWIIDLSERKTSILLEVMKLQTQKKPVELRGYSDEESEVMSFLHCLPYISQLRFDFFPTSVATLFLLQLVIKAAETERHTGDQMLKLLTSVCTYTSFPYGWKDKDLQSDFLLDLYSHVKDYESQTGRNLLPALQSVFQTPDVWIIDLSERKTSILLEVMKLQTQKKPVELRGYSDKESEVMSFLHCLPYISQLSGADQYVLSLVKLVQFRENPELVMSLFQALDFNFSLEGRLPSSTCRFVGGVLHLSADRLAFTVKPQAISLRGTRLLFRHITNIHTLRLSGYMVVRIVRTLRSAGVRAPVTVNELSVDLNDKQQSERKMLRVLSGLSSLLRLWTVQCLNVTEWRMKSLSLTVLLCQQSPLTLRVSKEILQVLTECVYEAQEEELSLRFLKKVGGDLTSCSLNWEKLHYFLQHEVPHVTVDPKEKDVSLNIKEILPFLHKIHFQQMSSTFMLFLIREIYESRSSGFVFGLLSSVENCINLQNRALDSVDCAALHFILQNCTAVTLNMLWTSIPEEELESILPLLSHVSHLSVDRLLLLRMFHCCGASDVQQEASALLLSALQHKLDFSCGSALDLTEDTLTQTLQLTAEDCHVMSAVIQRAYIDTHTLTQLNLHDCEINTAGIDEIFTVLRSVKLSCDKSLLLQFLSHVGSGEAEALSQALGGEVDVSQTQLDLRVCRGLALVLEHSEGLTELDLSHCHVTDQCLDLLLPNLHKAQNIDFSGNSITDDGAQKIYNIVSCDSNIKTVRLFNNRIKSRELFSRDPRYEIW